uniref:Uncharacterized protein n=1 Tax=Haptolina brevifila TaxID=156173 RepID=A0A7S2CTS8_9EUKA|mmetsp:Transcript_28779/g.57934  ORF Transcript_28779/g.57934 Transcript_28779/m.57934 type:complete len:143 (+) Transcript_28779:357-785(+)
MPTGALLSYRILEWRFPTTWLVTDRSHWVGACRGGDAGMFIIDWESSLIARQSLCGDVDHCEGARWPMLGLDAVMAHRSLTPYAALGNADYAMVVGSLRRKHRAVLSSHIITYRTKYVCVSLRLLAGPRLRVHDLATLAGMC